MRVASVVAPAPVVFPGSLALCRAARREALRDVKALAQALALLPDGVRVVEPGACPAERTGATLIAGTDAP